MLRENAPAPVQGGLTIQSSQHCDKNNRRIALIETEQKEGQQPCAGELVDNLEEEKKQLDESLLQCQECGEPFFSYDELKDHEFAHTLNDQLRAEDLIYRMRRLEGQPGDQEQNELEKSVISERSSDYLGAGSSINSSDPLDVGSNMDSYDENPLPQYVIDSFPVTLMAADA